LRSISPELALEPPVDVGGTGQPLVDKRVRPLNAVRPNHVRLISQLASPSVVVAQHVVGQTEECEAP